MLTEDYAKRFKPLLDALDTRFDFMHETLINWSETNSGTTHLAGIKKMQEKVIAAFDRLDANLSIAKSDDVPLMDNKGRIITHHVGDTLSFTKREDAPFQILLSGHLDTVFASDDAFQKVTPIDAHCLNGPGVADMKGGLLVMLEALSFFEQTDLKDSIGWQVIINADEEIGSPGSASFLDKAAKGKHLALVYEPSMTKDGMFAGSRKGSGKFSLSATGKSAHAGRDFANGRNAICFLAEVIQAINALNGQQDGATVNVGYVHGGGPLNQVPDSAICKLDVRILDDKQAQWVKASLDEIVNRYQQKEGYQLALHGAFSRPSKPLSAPTLKLFHLLKECGGALELPVAWAPSGGCCDGNNYAKHGLAVVDTLGVRGGYIHQDQEFIILDSLVERAKLSSLLLMALSSGIYKDFINGNAISTDQS